jgi:hypothetical protein
MDLKTAMIGLKISPSFCGNSLMTKPTAVVGRIVNIFLEQKKNIFDK